MSTLVIKRPRAFAVTMEMIESGLKGNELIVFAYLGYLCYNVQGCYKGGLGKLSRDLKLSEPTIISIIKKLVGYGLIEKDYYLDSNKVKKCVIRVL